MAGDTPAATEARIRAHALELFLARGVDATPLREIADALEVTKAALYYHFPSKDALLRRLVSPYLDDLGAVLLEHEEGGPPHGLHDLLVALATARIRNADAVRLLIDPAVRRTDRLAARIAELHERTLAAVERAADLPTTDRPAGDRPAGDPSADRRAGDPPAARRIRTDAALGALGALTSLPGPDRPAPEEIAAVVATLADSTAGSTSSG